MIFISFSIEEIIVPWTVIIKNKNLKITVDYFVINAAIFD